MQVAPGTITKGREGRDAREGSEFAMILREDSIVTVLEMLRA